MIDHQKSGILTLEILKKAVSGTAAAFRCRRRLQPAGGAGDKVFPPTYAGAKYASEQRRIPGQDTPVECVLLDSVQSQANRMEEALQRAIDEEEIRIPLIQVDFSGQALPSQIGRITSLQVPHRIADAIIRDSLLDGTPFRSSEIGASIGSVGLGNATPLYRYCPTALVFGMWDSTGPSGGMGAKFARAMVSEIVGIGAVYGVKTSSRIDPLQIRMQSGPIYESNDRAGISWTLDQQRARQNGDNPVLVGKEGKPSEVNHGNVTPDIDYRRNKNKIVTDPRTGLNIPVGGVTLDYAEQVTVLSLPALRRLRFPLAPNERDTQEVNRAAQTVLAALSLCAATLASENGLDLRSRCLLYPCEIPTWEILDTPGEQPETVCLDRGSAIALLRDSVQEAQSLGLYWTEEPITLMPDPALVSLVLRSQEHAVQEPADDNEGE